MFESIIALVGHLAEFEDGITEKKYSACRDARKLLQQVRKEAWNLRVAILAASKEKV